MPGVDAPESKVDLLIIGAGPAGMMAAAWAAHTGIKARIIDKRNTKIFTGQADGLQCRTLEIFESLGFADRVWKEANHMIEFSMWNPGPDGKLRRDDRVPDSPIGISRWHESVLHQGRIERFFLDNIGKYSRENGNEFSVERGVLPLEIELEEGAVEDDAAWPVKVKVRHLSEEEASPEQHEKADGVSDGLFRSNLAPDDTEELQRRTSGMEGREEVIRAKYVVGCDGAHSWTRRQLGYKLEGEPTDYIWGVLDIVPITDFPDIRNRCSVHSESSGSLMVIPRENSLVRLYVQVNEIKPDAETGRADRSKITPELILKSAQKVLAPYKLEYKHCSWWTAYQIGQRVGTNFSKNERIFLAGDAVHTHSPKAGQGMNVSMQDTYNLGWKIAHVVQGKAPRSILKTYQSERRRIAQDLINFDHKFSRLFSGRPAKDAADEAGVSMEEFKRVFLQGAMFASGLSVDYGRSMLIAKEGSAKEQGDGTEVESAAVKVVGNQALCKAASIGMRFPSFQVLNQSGARPWPFQVWLKSDGRYRVVLFAGNVKEPEQRQRVDKWCEEAEKSGSWLKKYTPAGATIDSVIEILTIHSAPRVDCNLLEDFPDLLHPMRPNYMGWDYNKVFVDDASYHDGHGEAYKNYGVDPVKGCVVAVRPDGYTGFIGELEDVEGLSNYFAGCLLPASKASNGS
ncbi:Ubiquinone biosynthesis monooxygenase COQ6, mitochondrial [Elsinoe australis]|uniref:Ubiquinone biosynthesis monooxygenase COQ6, mitochondrial n=1 Tax=Elsinoe australis TaxID=40998 RepID=A0A2P7YDK3_9PEZI|nr:Ubiquinone biosynthesis monooxygenase COQ6, mitochondrial [Elsinoe australis]